jgi:cbb3-type cytochrome oxidase subunit 3
MLVTLVLALPLSLLTIAVAWFAFRPLLSVGLAALAVVLVGGLSVIIWKRKPKAAAPAPA